MELKDTINLMSSTDYKERFKAEYLQAKIRYDKLDAMTVLVGGPDTLDFSGLTLPSTSGGSLLDDYVAMKQYYVDGKSALIGQPIDSPY